MISPERRALMWVFDRLTIEGGLTDKELHTTVTEIGKVLTGRPSRASEHEPNEWDPSAKMNVTQ